MKQATEKQMEAFLNECEVDYDIYNYDKDLAILNDAQGGEIARIDFDNSICEIEDTIFIDEDEYLLNDDQKDHIYRFLSNKVKSSQEDKSERKNEKYERPYFYLEQN